MAEKLNFINTSGSATSGTTARLAYPDNLFEDYTDYVMFDFFKYQGPFSGDGGGGTTDINGVSSQLQTYNQTNGSQYKRYPNLNPSRIVMYMPEDISTGYQTDWTGKGFSNIGTNMLRTGGAALAGDGGATITSCVCLPVTSVNVTCFALYNFEPFSQSTFFYVNTFRTNKWLEYTLCDQRILPTAFLSFFTLSFIFNLSYIYNI